jgi:hypothetical protein
MPAPTLATSVSGNSREQSSVPVNLDAKEAVDIAQALDENVFLFVPNLIGQHSFPHSSPAKKNPKSKMNTSLFDR